MTNDELRALYEEMPWAWIIQRNNGNGWEQGSMGVWWGEQRYRLKPKLPADLPEPTEDMMNRAVYLGKGPINMVGGVRGRFTGWTALLTGAGLRWKMWDHMRPVEVQHYCIDINDPNAREIIALNRTEPSYSGTRGAPITAHDVAVDVSLDDPKLVEALKEAGWTPPDPTSLREEAQQCYSRTGLKEFAAKHFPDMQIVDSESQWLRLDECEWEEMDRQHTDRKGNNLWGAVSFERAILVMYRHGPASVRVRRKK